MTDVEKIVVLFTGTVSTGKTTLLKEIGKELDGLRIPYTVSSNVVRNLIEQKVIDKDVDVSANNQNQVIITTEVMCQFWEGLQDDNAILLSDRSPIDVLAYSRNRKDTTEYVNNLSERFLKTFFSFKNVKFLVFYFPPSIPFEKDEIRNEKGRKKIDREIKKILKEFSIPFITIKDTILPYRVDFIKNLLFLNFIQGTSRP